MKTEFSLSQTNRTLRMNLGSWHIFSSDHFHHITWLFQSCLKTKLEEEKITARWPKLLCWRSSSQNGRQNMIIFPMSILSWLALSSRVVVCSVSSFALSLPPSPTKISCFKDFCHFGNRPSFETICFVNGVITKQRTDSEFEELVNWSICLTLSKFSIKRWEFFGQLHLYKLDGLMCDCEVVLAVDEARCWCISCQTEFWGRFRCQSLSQCPARVGFGQSRSEK